MNLRDEGFILSARAHGEHGAIVRLFTAHHGLVAGYVHGGRSRRMRPVMIPGNQVFGRLTRRAGSQLGLLSLELITSRAPLMHRACTAAAVEWLTAIKAALLPEQAPFPRLYDSLGDLWQAMAENDAPHHWLPALVRHEVFLLGELGAGLDLSDCAATGSRDDLAFISPRSSRAVSRTAGAPYATKLLPLPAFLLNDDAPKDGADLMDGLKSSGYFINRHLLTAFGKEHMLQARQRMIHLARINVL